MPLWDRYGRPLLNVRLAVTLRCNFRCFFCHMEGLVQRNENELTPYEYLVIALAARKLGIRSFKVTGGEPLVRRDILEVIDALREGHPEAEISLTTNGFFLEEYAAGLAERKLSHINVSLHSLDPHRFKEITGVNGLEKVLKGLKIAYEHGIRLKINTVVLRGINESELWKLIELAGEYNASIHLIELHPVGLGRKVFEEYHIPASAIASMLEKRAARVEYRLDLHNRLTFYMDNGVIVELVGPTGNSVFCAGCTRIRISPYGEMTPCLNRGDERVEFRSRVRSAKSLEDAVEAVVEAFRMVNTLRRPYYLYTLKSPPVPRRHRTYRLYIPKRNGVIDERIERKLLAEWLDVD